MARRAGPAEAATKLRACIDRTGLTDHEVAVRLGISGAALSGFLSGKLTPRTALIRSAIARFTRGEIQPPEWDTDEDLAELEAIVPAPKGEAAKKRKAG